MSVLAGALAAVGDFLWTNGVGQNLTASFLLGAPVAVAGFVKRHRIRALAAEARALWAARREPHPHVAAELARLHRRLDAAGIPAHHPTPPKD